MELTLFVFCHQDHAIAFDAPHFPGREIGNHHYLLAGDLLRAEMQRNAGDDRALFVPQIHGQLQQLIGLFYFFSAEDRAYFQLQFSKIIINDLGFCSRLFSAGVPVDPPASCLSSLPQLRRPLY